jgi:hypothetical protein
MEFNKSETLEQINSNLEFYTEQLIKLRGLTEKIDILDPDLEMSELKEIKLLNDFNAILIISILDTIEIQKGILTAVTKWDKIYFAKNTYLTIYETINSLGKINSFIFKLINENYPQHKVNYGKIKKDLRTFKSIYSFDGKIYNIRNKVAGHIEPNLKKYFDIIDNINGDEAIKVSFDFYLILNKFSNLCTDIAVEANNNTNQKFNFVHDETIAKLNGIIKKLSH